MHTQNNEVCYVEKCHQGDGEKTKYDQDVGNNKHKKVAKRQLMRQIWSQCR